MKKTMALTIIGFLCLSTLSVLAPQIKANSETIMFEDDFETYAVGSFPSAGGWELIWNGKGTAYQVVTDTVSYSPTKSLRLWGQSGWSANVQRKFTSSAEIIGFEAYVRTESNTGSGWKVAGICFWKLDSPVPWGKRFADVGFGPDGQLYTRPVKGSSSYIPLGLTYEADTWYKVRVVIDRTVEAYDVWIDDVLVAEDVDIWDTHEIDALMLESGHSAVQVYFDDVKVFEGARGRETPLEVAEKAAAYVISQSIPESGGYKWMVWPQPGESSEWLGQTGISGIGTFLVSLCEKTDDSIYLDYAKGAAQWLITKAVRERGGYAWRTHKELWKLSTTVHDVGELLLRMYKATGNSTYLEYAKGAAQWMVAMAEYEAGGCFIPYNPPGKFGSQMAAGIMPNREAQTATFLLHMYQETGNTTYLDYVTGTAEWLMYGPDIVAEDGGYKWAHDRPYYVHPERKYHIPGNAMIALFFYEIFQELGTETYLDYANGALQWILSQSVSYDDMCKWPWYPGSTTYYLLPMTDSYIFDNVNDVLLIAYRITSNPTYLEYARKHANWVISQAVSEGGGYKFPRYEGAGSDYYSAFFNALVYRFLNEIYEVVGDASFSEYADGAFAWIVNTAMTTDGGYKWEMINYYPYYPWWFQNGASGIGYYLTTGMRVRAWKDYTSLGLENDRLLLHGSAATGNYRWFFDYLIFKDTGTTWYQPWGELAIIVYPIGSLAPWVTGDYEINAVTEADKAYLTYSVTQDGLRQDVTYTIYPSEPYIHITFSTTNIGSTIENTWAGVQFTTWIAGDYANDYYYVPGYGERQFTGSTNDIHYTDATETWVATWDQDKGEGAGILSTKGFNPSNIMSIDWGVGEGFRFTSDSFNLDPGQSSETYDCYLYFFTGTGHEKVKDFYDYLRARVRFSPIVDGFQFSNYWFTERIKRTLEEVAEDFESSSLAYAIPPEYWLPFELYIHALIWMQKGYCGGMVLTAEDYFESPNELPSDYSCTHDIPIDDTTAFNRIVYNQWVTQFIDDDYLLKFLLLRLGDDPSGLVELDKDLEWILDELDKGNPVDLVVFDPDWSTGLKALTGHAVLAYDYSISGEDIELRVYGPNLGYMADGSWPIEGHLYETDSEGGQSIHLTKDASGSYVIVNPSDPTSGSFIEGFEITRLGSTEAPTWGLTWADVWPYRYTILGHVIEYVMEVATEYTEQFMEWLKDHLKDIWSDLMALKEQAEDLWNQFVDWVMDNTKSVWNRIVHFKLHSPADLHVYDSMGMHVGLTTVGDLDLEFDALYLLTDELQYCAMPDPQAGSYVVELQGVGDGSYTLDIAAIVGGTTVTEQTVSGEITQGEIRIHRAFIPESGDDIIIDDTPPTTTLTIGEPKYATVTQTFVTSETPFMLEASDDIGSGVASTTYRIYNATYDSGWIKYTEPFYLVGLSDGMYSVDYNSTDNAGNVEVTNTVAVILDNSSPTTIVTIGEPKYAADTTYVTLETPFMLDADDDEGSGVDFVEYRIHNSTFDSGWLTYTVPFHLTGLADGVYTIEFCSTDNVGNVEPPNIVTVFLDNTEPLVAIINPPAGWALQDGVNFIASATDDGSGVHYVNFSIREANGGDGIPVGFENLPATYDVTTDKWTLFFDTLLLPDGYYVVLVEAEDNLGHIGSTIVPYSIRNWAILELLPATENNKAGRTMPVKFTLRVAAAVDPEQPFVYNEELTIEICDTDNPTQILQESTFGDTAKDYRINTTTELYITNFRTLKQPMQYTVSVYRGVFFIDSFGFQTVK